MTTTTFEATSNQWIKAGEGKTTGVREAPVFAPVPERRPRKYLVISADDHVVEPPDAFVGRLPAKYQERAPRVIELEDGSEVWTYDGNILPNIGLNAVVGKPLNHKVFEPARFDEMLRGAWDIRARVEDMDRDGVYASLCFPSFLAGFGGLRLQMTPDDKDFAFAMLQAYNDWHLESWAGSFPGRIIPQQIPWLLDPVRGAEEIRKNAARGFRAVTFPEYPDKAGLPSLWHGYWDPFLEACAETNTVVNLHTGSAGTVPTTSPDAPVDVTAVLFGVTAVMPTVDWLFSQVCVRFPQLRIVLSEGGLSWVSGLLDRLRHEEQFQELAGTWSDKTMSPSDVLRRNFRFCAMEEKNAFVNRHHVGIDTILSETDYPHRDSTFPDTQAIMEYQLGDIPWDEAQRITWQNASELYDWPVPPEVVENFEYYDVDATYSSQPKLGA